MFTMNIYFKEFPAIKLFTLQKKQTNKLGSSYYYYGY